MDISKLISIALPIIFSNEGNYSSINPDDGDKVKAVSIGKIQWHANRALNLLKRIIKANDKAAQIILGQALYKEIKSAKDWSHKITNNSETKSISYLINTQWGRLIQDQQAIDDVTAYIKHGVTFGIIDGKALIYYADCENQGGAGASKSVAKDALKKAGNSKKISLDIYHACALVNDYFDTHQARRLTVYNKLLKIELYNQPISNITPVSSENDICWLQSKFNAWLIYMRKINPDIVDGLGFLDVDGRYGTHTKSAVTTFYGAQGWKTDGLTVGYFARGRLAKI